MSRGTALKPKSLARLIIALLALALCAFLAGRIINPPAKKSSTAPRQPRYPAKLHKENAFSVRLPASFAGLRHEMRSYTTVDQMAGVTRWFAESDPLIFEIFLIRLKHGGAEQIYDAISAAEAESFQPRLFMSWSGVKVFPHENNGAAAGNAASSHFDDALLSPALVRRALKKAKLEDMDPMALRENILVFSLPDEDALHINVFGENPRRCRAVADAIAAEFLESAGAHLFNYERSLERDLAKEEQGIRWYDREIAGYIKKYGLKNPDVEKTDLERLISALEIKRIREKMNMDELYEKALSAAQTLPGVPLPVRPKPGFGEAKNTKKKPPKKTTEKSGQATSDTADELSPEQKLDEELRRLELERAAIDITHPDDKAQMKQLESDIQTNRNKQHEMRRKAIDKKKKPTSPGAEAYGQLLLDLDEAGALYLRTDRSVKEMKKQQGTAGGLGAELVRLVRERADRRAVAAAIRGRRDRVKAKRMGSPARVEITDHAGIPKKPAYPDSALPLFMDYIMGAARVMEKNPIEVAGTRGLAIQSLKPWRTGARVPVLEAFFVHGNELIILRVTAVDETALKRPDVQGFFTSFQFE